MSASRAGGACPAIGPSSSSDKPCTAAHALVAAMVRSAGIEHSRIEHAVERVLEQLVGPEAGVAFTA